MNIRVKTTDLITPWCDILAKQQFSLSEIGANETFQELLRGEQIETIHTDEATLEDVFIEVTGKTLR